MQININECRIHLAHKNCHTINQEISAVKKNLLAAKVAKIKRAKFFSGEQLAYDTISQTLLK